jgi:hypothetical protein
VVSNIFYFPFHIWDVILPIDELHHFSRWLLQHQPVVLHHAISCNFSNQNMIPCQVMLRQRLKYVWSRVQHTRNPSPIALGLWMSGFFEWRLFTIVFAFNHGFFTHERR